MRTQKPLHIVILLISSVICWSCQPSTQNSENTEPEIRMTMTFEAADFTYDLSAPDEKFDLPPELTEVSGLSFTDDGKLVMVQDEEGTLFFMDIEKGEVLEERIKFERKGDFEGVEIVGDTAYVLKSNGEISNIYPFQSDDRKVKKYKTDLGSRNDPEGLGYLKHSHQLLIACKATPNISGKKQKDHRAIYVFDLGTGEYATKLHLQIPIKGIRSILGDNAFNRLSKDIAKIFSEGGDISFQPSGIAVHPITSNIYVIASVGKLLVVFNQKGAMVNMVKLDNSIFKQPEGICFNPDGDLFISNEGKQGQGNVLRFNYLAASKNESE